MAEYASLGSSERDSDSALEWAFFAAVVQQILLIILVLSRRAPKLCVDGDAERGRCQPCQKAWSGSGKGIRHRQFEARRGSGNSFDHDPVISEAVHLERKSDGRCLLVAGSSHRGEEEIMLDAFRSLKRRFPDLQMVLAPRHPQRFPEVERLLKASGMEFEKKSQTNGRSLLMEDICFLDTLGDLQEFYALGDIAFVGGSLVDAGGHNLLEPARVRKPVLFGPYMANFAAIAEEMKTKGGGVEVRGVEDLVREITDLLSDTDKRLAMGERAYHVAADGHRVGERTSEIIVPLSTTAMKLKIKAAIRVR